MALTLVSNPAEEPVTLIEAKAHLRVDVADDDALIAGLIVAARQHVEQFTRRVLVTQTWDLFLDEWPEGNCLVLPLPHLVSVTGVYYTPDGGVEQTFGAGSYLVDAASEPGRVVLKTTAAWPGDSLQPVNGVRVRFVAGYGGRAAVPSGIKQAIKLIVGDLYENRENTVVGQGISMGKLPMGVEWLLWPYRVLSF